MKNERMSDSLKKFCLKKSKILFFSLLYIGFLFKKMRDSLIPSFWVSYVSELFRSLSKNERILAIRSGRSIKMSDHELIAQVAHQKLLVF